MKETANVYRPSFFGTPRLYQRGVPVFVAKKEAQTLRGWVVTKEKVIDYSVGGQHDFVEVPI